MSRVPNKPRRRTYRTGGQLPALTDEFRPIPLGRDEQGDNDGQIRAMAVLLRNRADSPVYIREGPDSDDQFAIGPGEDYRIWEPNGVNTLTLKGESGGESVEVRALEAHNDFSFTDRIESFARSIGHFFGTAQTSSNIQDQEIDLSTINRTSEQIVRRLYGVGRAVDRDDNRNDYYWTLYDGAPFDGRITSYTVRFYAHEDFMDDTIGMGDELHHMAALLEIDNGDGYVSVTPRDAATANYAKDYQRDTNEVNVIRFDRRFEARWKYEPNEPIEFQEDDSVRFHIRSMSDTLDPEANEDPAESADYYMIPDPPHFRVEIVASVHRVDS